MEISRTDKEEMCIYLLRKYPEIKYMNMNARVLSGAGQGSIDEAVKYMENEARCSRLAVRKIRKQRESWELDLLEYLEEMKERLIKHGRESDICVLDKLYFSRKSAFLGIEQQCRELNIGRNRFYSVRKSAEQAFYTGMEESFDICRAYSNVKRAMDFHDAGGPYYHDAEMLLKRYRKVRFAIVNDMLDEMPDDFGYDIASRIDFAENIGRGCTISRWMNSSMMENTFAELLVIEDAVRQMKYFGKEGREACILLKTVYTGDVDYGIEESIEKLGMSQRVYYMRRKKAIAMFSKILWGPLGHRYLFTH